MIILGLDSAGKTAIYNTLAGSDADYKQLKPTGGFNTKKVKFAPVGITSEQEYTLDLWEIGGADKIRPHWPKYSKDKDAVIFVIDSSDKARVDEAIELL